MKIISIILTILFIQTAYCQEVDINRKFIIELNTNDISEMNLEIISIEPYNKILQTSNVDEIFSVKPRKNQIFGVFAKGKFGNKNGSILILESGFDEPISYELKIKSSNKQRFKKTSTTIIYKGVKSVEYWPDKLANLKFVEFKKNNVHNDSDYLFEVKIDSSCIIKPRFNIENGNDLLVHQIKFLFDSFSNEKGFNIEEVKNYETLIASDETSPGNYDAFTPNEGYIDKKKLSHKPLRYSIIECPFFERETHYFFNKRNKEVRLVLFDWDNFEYSNFPPKTNYEKIEMENALKAKHGFIINNISKIFGEPLNEKPIKVSGRLETGWIAENGIKAKTYLFVHKGIYEIRLYIYK